MSCMLRHLGIRWKVLGVLVLPVLAMAVTSGAIAVTALSDAAAAQRAGRLAQAGDAFGRVAAALQQERLDSLRVLAGDRAARAALASARQRTDADVAALNLALVTSDVSGLSTAAAVAVDRSRQAHTRLRGVRDGVDAGTVAARRAQQIYTEIIRLDIDLPDGIGESLADRALAQPLTISSLLGRVGEAASREQLAGLAMIRAGSPTAAQQRDLGVAVLDADRTLDEVRNRATSAQLTAITAALTSGRVTDADLGRLRTALAGAGSARPVPVTAADWSYITGQRAEQLRQVGHLVSATAAGQAEERVTAARLRAAIALGSTVVLVGVSVLLALVLSRRITAPLRRLTDDATWLAAQLPTLVGKVATGQAVTLPEVAVDGGDEVAALALAFRSVNATTLEVAHQQAGLRAAVADMFVCIARRNQVLLARQLAFIDQLERAEESPQTLENLFRLDHLATRMRRNAESLLVLAGADGGRRLRAPMLLSDVVRSAVSEVEHFDRVRIAGTVDPLVVAHLALPTAHLLAELVENAAAFSDPGAPVLVETRATEDGVRVSVRDSGLGLSGAELADANARLANGGVADVVGSQRLGFFVVARLAAKIGAEVHLSAGAGGGTVADVDLGAVVFVAGSIDGGPDVQSAAGANGGSPSETPTPPEGPDPQRVPAMTGAVQQATRSADDATRGVELPGRRLVVDLEVGTSAVLGPTARSVVEPVAPQQVAQGAEPTVEPTVGPSVEPGAEGLVEEDIVPLTPPEPMEVYTAWLPVEAQPVEEQRGVEPVVAYDPLTDPDFVVEDVPAPFADALGLPASPVPPAAETVAPARTPLVRVLPDEPAASDPVPAPDPVRDPVPASAATPGSTPPLSRPPSSADPEPAPHPDPAPPAPGLSLPHGAVTMDVLPTAHQHRGGLLRGLRDKAADAWARDGQQLDAPAGPVRRAVTSEQPPSRRTVREGIGWLPPESPDLFADNGSEPVAPWAGRAGQDEERLRHAITSEALNELSRLSSYSPAAVQAAPAESLTRRTPAPAPAPTPAPSAPPMSVGTGSVGTGVFGTGSFGAEPFSAEALAAPLLGGRPPERFAEPGPETTAPATNSPETTAPGPAPAGGLPLRVRSGSAPDAPSSALPRPRTADGVRATVAGFTDGVRRARQAPVGEPDA